MIAARVPVERSARPNLWRSRWAAIGAAVAVSMGAGGFFVAQAAPGPDESTVVMVSPERILDTRDPNNIGLAGPFVSPVSQKLQVTGSAPTATGTKIVVPAGATGVLLNVTAVSPTAAGCISIRPGDATGAPTTSSLNVSGPSPTGGSVSIAPGGASGAAALNTATASIIPNGVQVALPASGANAGRIDITYDAYGVSGPTTDLLIDVVGYMTNTGLAQLTAEVQALTDELQQLTADVSPLFAVIRGDQNVPAVYEGISSGLVSVTRVGTGIYDLEFDRPVDKCAAATADWTFHARRDISVDMLIGGAHTARVAATDSAGAYVDALFNIIMQCPLSGAVPFTLSDVGAPNPNAQ